jgi:hypothetical protein
MPFVRITVLALTFKPAQVTRLQDGFTQDSRRPQAASDHAAEQTTAKGTFRILGG